MITMFGRLSTDLVHLDRVRHEIHRLAYQAVQIRVPFSHQASGVDRRLYGIPARNVTQRLTLTLKKSSTNYCLLNII